jgi:hypothetical protein
MGRMEPEGKGEGNADQVSPKPQRYKVTHRQSEDAKHTGTDNRGWVEQAQGDGNKPSWLEIHPNEEVDGRSPVMAEWDPLRRRAALPRLAQDQ